jgi:MFS family permease
MRFLRKLRADLVPPAGNERRYAFAVFLDSIGDGLFLTGTAVFAMRAIGLSGPEVGVALSAAGVAGFVGASTLGTLADRFGARRMMLLMCLLEAAGYLFYLLVDSFASFTVLTCLIAVVAFGKGPAASALVSGITTGERRVRLRAQVRSLHNLSFTLGAALAGLAFAVATMPAYYALPLGDAVMVFAEALVVRRLPEVRAAREPGTTRAITALRNVPFLTTTALSSVLSLHGSLIMVVIPLWIVERTTAPDAVISVLLVLNTLTVVLFQVRATAGSDTLPGSLRKIKAAAYVLMPGCVVVGFSAGMPVVLAVVLVAGGVVLLTFGEILQSASSWGMAYELAPRQAQGEYLSALEMSLAAQSIVGPALGTWLVLGFGLAGWAVLAVLFGLAAVLIGPAARATARSVARLYPEPAPAADTGEPEIREAA